MPVELATPCPPPNQVPLELNLSFGSRVNFSVPGGQPQDLMLADLDADGRPDLVSANTEAGAFVVFRNLTPEAGDLAPSTFAAPQGFGAADSTPSLAAADLDGDGKVEVIVNPRSLGALQVFRNTSTAGSLAFAVPLVLPNVGSPPGASSTDVAVGDFDRDGVLDLVVANREDGEVACYRNTSIEGAIAFAGRQVFPAGARPTQVAVGDIDGDGWPDLVVANQDPAGLTLLRNTSSAGAIAFAGSPVTFAAPGVLTSVAVADLDRDGKREVLGAAPVLGGVLVWRNTARVGVFSATSPSSLAEPLLFATGCAPVAVAVAEIDGDGYPDLAVANLGQNSVSLLGNQSAPGRLEFASRGEFPTGRGPLALALADLNGDRRPDLGVADVLAGRVHVRQNRAAFAAAGLITFTIDGAAPPLTEPSVTAHSANEGLIPDENLSLLGSGTQHTLVATPRPGVSGVARVTVRVEDAAHRVVENEVVLLVGCTLNAVWSEACELGLAEDAQGELHASVQQSLDQAGEGRWYRFKVQPESQLFLILSGLPKNYDLFLFQDIRAAYEEIEGDALTTEDLLQLNARYAPAAYSPAAYSPAAYSPMVYSPAAYSPAAYSPAAYSPMVYSPAAYSPAAYSPAAYSPAAYSPAAYSDNAFAPAAYSPAAYSGPADAPVAFSPAAYSGAQTRSLLAASAFDGTASEGIFMNTWTSTGDFFVCVRGRDGAHSEGQPFRLDIHLVPGACGALDTTSIPPSTTAANSGPGDGYRTLILADFARLNRAPDPGQAADWAAAVAALRAKLDTFAARPEVQGAVVDLATDAAVVAANQLADQAFNCVFAKNVVARRIQDIVAGFRALNPALEFLVLVGGDDVIPNFRYPDNTPLGAEQNFIVPVRDATASQATLRLGYFMSQDAYGAACELQQKLTRVPIPGLAAGRLVETPDEILGQLDAYLALPGGRLSPARSSLVTGYEFLADVAEAVHAELRAGIGEGQGQVHDALIAPAGLSPDADPATTENWSAQELAQVLFARRHDLIFLAGHYNDGSALAADYKTELTAREVAESPVDMQHSIVFGAGCHVGYNTVDRHAEPGVTQNPDWAQALARKRATLIGGWGYQYGDTELVEYSERLYRNFAEQLRRGFPGGTLPVGKALLAAKRQYLDETDDLRAIHEKAVLQVALFGLPMLQVDLPHKAAPGTGLEAIVPSTARFATDPGGTLGLRWADATLLTSALVRQTRSLGVYDGDGNLTGTVQATYLEGPQGSASHPAEPVLPLVVKDVSSPMPGQVLRGVGFRGGTYTDEADVRQLTGTPATEFRGAVVAFQSLVFHPVQPWSVNYFGALCNTAVGTTRLNLLPAQYRTDPATPELGTRRVFSEMQLRFYYSGDVATYTDPPGENPDTPALADAPTIVEVEDAVAGGLVTISASVVGNPAAGIQEVWVTYTAEDSPWRGRWQALDLTQDLAISSRWTGTLTLPAGVEAAEVRYAVHAVNGVGLATMNANRGAFFTPGAGQTDPAPTSLTLDGFPLTGRYGDTATFSAVLATSEGPVSGQLIRFGLGLQQVQAFTDANGRATAPFQLQGLPAAYALQLAFGGTARLASASASTGFEILRQPTAITLEDLTTTRPNLNVSARLADQAGRQIAEKSVFFVLTDSRNAVRLARAAITEHAGRASLGIVPLEAGTYTLRAYFNDRVPLPSDGSGETELVGTWQLDPRYEPVTQTGTYRFELVAANATIFRAPGRFAKVDIAGLLSASQGLATELRLQSVQAATPGDASVWVEDDWIVYAPPSNHAAPGSFTYTITDGLGNTATGAIQVLLVPNNPDPILNILSITENPGGSVRLRFIGVPGIEYHIQASESLEPEEPWTTLGTRVASGNGEFEFTDIHAAEHPTRYYRAVGP